MQAGGKPLLGAASPVPDRWMLLASKTAAYSDEYLAWAQSLFTMRMASDRGRARQGMETRNSSISA